MLDIKTVKPRPRNYHAVQFAGKNGKVIATWINEETRAERGGLDFAVARGSYVSVKSAYSDVWIKVYKGDWLVLDPDSEFSTYSDENFNLVFNLPKK